LSEAQSMKITGSPALRHRNEPSLPANTLCRPIVAKGTLKTSRDARLDGSSCAPQVDVKANQRPSCERLALGFVHQCSGNHTCRLWAKRLIGDARPSVSTQMISPSYARRTSIFPLGYRS